MKYAFTNGILLDGNKDMQPVTGKVIYTEDDRITKISDANENLKDYTEIDLAGKYLMPGLINMHVHLPASGKPKKKEQDNVKLVRMITCNSIMRKIGVKMCEDYAKMELNSGVTTIRTVGGVQDFDTIIRDQVKQGYFQGPRILASNMAVSVPGGHMAGSLAYEATSASEAAHFVEVIGQEKPDLIKLMITGGVLDATKKGEPGELKMPPEYVKAACDKAHELGFKVAAHVESPEGVRVALENGVDSIEHGAKPDDDIIRLFKEKNACHIATLSPALPYALFDLSVSHATEMSKFNGQVVFDGIIDCAKACLANDIPVGLGTDVGCPFITHYDMWRELQYFHKYCEVSNSFALYTATKVNAQLLGMEDEIGTIEEGKCADMIVTQDNPLENLQALRNVSMVIARGQVIDAPKNKKYQEVEQELDKFL